MPTEFPVVTSYEAVTEADIVRNTDWLAEHLMSYFNTPKTSV